jgi:itaconate CoA-transferase
VSKFVARLDGPNTTPRIDTHWIVTEFGAANMKGMSSTERAKALIGLAHPEFRDGLMASAKELHLI